MHKFKLEKKRLKEENSNEPCTTKRPLMAQKDPVHVNHWHLGEHVRKMFVLNLLASPGSCNWPALETGHWARNTLVWPALVYLLFILLLPTWRGQRSDLCSFTPWPLCCDSPQRSQLITISVITWVMDSLMAEFSTDQSHHCSINYNTAMPIYTRSE